MAPPQTAAARRAHRTLVLSQRRAGDALGPGQVVGAVLELLGQQRRAPEQPEQQRDDMVKRPGR